MSHHFPYEIKPLDDKTEAELRQYYKGKVAPNVRIGPKGYFLPAPYQLQAATVYNLPLRPDDTFVVTFPRSGTTWTQELVWLIRNDLDYETAQKTFLTDRYPFIEQSMFMDEASREEIKNSQMDEKTKKEFIVPTSEILAATPSPRFVKTHLPLSLLPPSLLDTTKVVYVAREPRDAMVSFYHFTKSNKLFEFVGDFDVYMDWFLRDLVTWCPYFEHIKEAWQLRNHPNMLFLFYEELYKDLAGTCERVAKFFGKNYSREEIEKLAEYLRFDNFKNNKAVDLENMKKAGVFNDDLKFVRKGKSGTWREQMTAAQAQRATRWVQENLRDTDLRFPEV